MEANTDYTCDVAVVGGGPGGLATAALLAERGMDVVVLERAGALGGRARTRERQYFYFNEGPHALYAAGAAMRVLGCLGVSPRGRKPPTRGLAVLAGAVHALPSTPGALLSTGLLGWSSKIAGLRFFARVGSFDTDALARVPWSDWVDEAIPDAAFRAAIETFVRVTSYANAPSLISAGATVEQLRLAQKGVLYLDGGWQPLVDAMASAAERAGARVQTQARVVATERQSSGWSVTLADRETLTSRALVLAISPLKAHSLVASEALATWAEQAVPARVACLDVALSRLPNERAGFALGIDQPLYLSVHSNTARLAPDGAALVSAMKYLPAGRTPDATRDRAELEAWLDLLQPGWREVLVECRWLASMVATNAIVAANAARPGPRVPDMPGLFVVGDWVDSNGMLLDASLSSAERAAEALSASPELARVA